MWNEILDKLKELIKVKNVSAVLKLLSENKLTFSYNPTKNVYNITLNNLTISPYIHENKETTKELFEKDQFYLTRSDLLEDDIAILDIDKHYEKLISSLTSYLNSDDLGALLSSIKAIKFENNRETEKSNKTIENIRLAYAGRGAKIYNMTRSHVFEMMIIPQLQAIKSNNSDESKIKGEFIEFFDSILNFNPMHIWVNLANTLKKIQIGLIQRLITKKSPFVIVYARNEKCIKKVEDVCHLFITENKECKCFVSPEYLVRGKKSKNFLIVNKKSFEELFGVDIEKARDKS